MSQRDDEPDEALEAWSTYREISEAVHSDIRKAVNTYSYLNSMHTQGMGITPQQAVRAKTYILRIVKRLQYEIEMSRAKGDLDEIADRWSGEDGLVAAFEGADVVDGETIRVAGELVDDVVSAAWTLGYLRSGRMEAQFEDQEQEDAAQVAEMFE